MVRRRIKRLIMFHETFISDIFGRIVELKVPALLLKNLKVLDTSRKEYGIEVDVNQVIEILFRKMEDFTVIDELYVV